MRFLEKKSRRLDVSTLSDRSWPEGCRAACKPPGHGATSRLGMQQRIRPQTRHSSATYLETATRIGHTVRMYSMSCTLPRGDLRHSNAAPSRPCNTVRVTPKDLAVVWQSLL